MHRLVLAILLVCGCRSPEHADLEGTPRRSPAASEQVASTNLSAAQPSAASAPTSVPTTSAPTASLSSTPLVDAPAGAVYGFIRERGVFRLTPEPALVIPSTSRSVEALAVAPDGSLWASFFDQGVVRFAQGKLETVSKEVYRELAFGASGEVWGVTQDLEWRVDRFDGKRFVPAKKRSELAGPFSDNQYDDLALTKDSVWVACWNGLFRFAGGQWQKVALPSPRAWQLASDGRRLFVRFADLGWHVTEDGARFDKVAWPTVATLLPGPTGHFVGVEVGDTPKVVLAKSLDQASQKSEPIAATSLEDSDVDARGRTWLATDSALIVLDRDGRQLSSWQPGTLPGVRGIVRQIAIEAGGPALLPARTKAEFWELRGVVESHKSRSALAGATVSICPSSLGCKDALPSRTTKTGANGAFRFAELPPGDFWIAVEAPPGASECGGIFRAGMDSFVSLSSCESSQPDARVCDVKTLQVCRPFERPPPR